MYFRGHKSPHLTHIPQRYHDLRGQASRRLSKSNRCKLGPWNRGTPQAVAKTAIGPPRLFGALRTTGLMRGTIIIPVRRDAPRFCRDGWSHPSCGWKKTKRGIRGPRPGAAIESRTWVCSPVPPEHARPAQQTPETFSLRQMLDYEKTT